MMWGREGGRVEVGNEEGIENEEVENVSERDGREEEKLGVVSKRGVRKEGRGNRRGVKDGGVEEAGGGRELWGAGMEEHIMRRNLETVREMRGKIF